MKEIQKQIILQIFKKLKYTPEQAIKDQRESRCIALPLLYNPEARWGVGGHYHALAALPRETPRTCCTNTICFTQYMIHFC